MMVDPQLNATKPGVLSTQGYRGTRDFYPADQRLRKWIYEKIASVMGRFGYEEYAGPLLEPLELYASKSSEEIVQEQLYWLEDKGNRKLGIRPEMTPTLARMVAARHPELPRPIRWYSIPTCMRYENPQRGRLREFDQLNVDICGGVPLDEDIEIILTAVELMRALGAKISDFEVRINHRGLINDFLYKVLGISESNKAPMLRLLDKQDKLTPEEFNKGCLELHLTENQISQLTGFMASDLDKAREFLGEHTENYESFKARFDTLNALLPRGCVVFSPSIMRGFDYYTGFIFEVFDTDPKNRRALFGGGRYDNLVGSFGVDALSGIGYGVSDVSLINFLEVHDLTPKLSKGTDVAVLRFSEKDRLQALQLAQILREAGLNVEAPVGIGKFGKQIQSAERSGAVAVAFLGEDEIKNGTFAVKFLKTGEQITLPCNAEGAQILIEKSV
jgi:histidyl-tRNA synthetase